MRHIDLRQYSDRDLSVTVMNNEYLFNNISDLKALKTILDDLYLYNDAQLAILQTDIKDYLFEIVEFNAKVLA